MSIPTLYLDVCATVSVIVACVNSYVHALSYAISTKKPDRGIVANIHTGHIGHTSDLALKLQTNYR